MLKYNKCYKKIRKNKGITQEKICSKYISRSTLSKFENEKSNISLDLYIYLLDSIDMSHEEFNYIANDYVKDTKTDIIESFFSIMSNHEVSKLKKLKEKCNVYLSKKSSIAISNISEVISSQLQLLNCKNSKPSCLSKIWLSKTWDRLEKLDEWYLHEIKIINCCLFFFPLKTTQFICEKLEKTLNKYDNHLNILPLKISIFSNLTLLFLQNNEKKYATYYAKLAKQNALESKRYDYISISYVREGICLGDTRLIDHGLSLLNYFQENELSLLLEAEVKAFPID